MTGTATVVVGDCRDVMATMDAESVDAVVTDPPAGIAFMSKTWDSDKGGRDAWIEWLTGVMREAFRVAKPGAHAVVWALPRTSGWTHRALEDAGWEIRDCCVHIFGSGFPKSANVPKMLDKMAGAEPVVLGPNPIASRQPGQKGTAAHGDRNPNLFLTAPATDLARQWDGWGTALKPAAEFWYLARKPFKSTVAANVAAYGTGGLNIGATRIGTTDSDDARRVRHNGAGTGNVEQWRTGKHASDTGGCPSGRWPSNVVLSHIPPDEHGEGGCREVGVRKVKGSNIPGSKPTGGKLGIQGTYGHADGGLVNTTYADPDGFKTVAAWECSPECPIFLLDEMSGERGNNWRADKGVGLTASPVYGTGRPDFDGPRGHADTGGASRFFLNVAPDEEATVWECSDECPVRLLDEMSGERESRPGKTKKVKGNGYGGYAPMLNSVSYPGDTGGASRFFLNVAPDEEATRFLYSPKASRRERNAGLEGMPERDRRSYEGGPIVSADHPETSPGGHTAPAANNHPTVKPLALMRWLVKLVTSPGGKILDPFCGSGTTGCAAALEGFGFVGIEQDAEYAEIARKRIAYWAAQEQPQTPPVRRPAKPRPPARDQPKPEQLGLLLDVAPVRLAAD